MGNNITILFHSFMSQYISTVIDVNKGDIPRFEPKAMTTSTTKAIAEEFVVK